MIDENHADRVWAIVERVGVCMFTTRSGSGLRARPLEARPDRQSGIIWFVTDRRSGKEHEIEAERDVSLAFVDRDTGVYLSITARAEILRDRAKAASIWKSTDNMWWNGPDDPNVCVLRVEPMTAELWDGPASGAVAAFEFVKATLTGAKPNLGENPQGHGRPALNDAVKPPAAGSCAGKGGAASSPAGTAASLRHR